MALWLRPMPALAVFAQARKSANWLSVEESYQLPLGRNRASPYAARADGIAARATNCGTMFDPCRCPHAAYSPRMRALADEMFGRRAFLLGAAASFAALFLPRSARAADIGTAKPGGVTLLRAARLFDGTTMRTPGVVVIRGDRIVSLMAGDAGSGATVLDLGDVTLMPGLIDAHTHVAANVVASRYLEAFGPKNEASSSVAEAALLSLANAQAMLANGFTTIRDVGGGAGIDLAMRDAIARGAVRGPRILAAGTALSITGGHGDTNDLAPWVHLDVDEQPSTAYGPYGFRQQVREHVKRQVDLIKITATGGVLSYGDTFDVPQLNLDEIRAVVAEAGKFGLKVSAHCHGDRGIAEAVAGGVHSIEHGTGVEDKTLHAMSDRSTRLVPTIWALDSILQPGNPNKIAGDSLEKAHRAANAAQRRHAARHRLGCKDRVRNRRRRLPARREQPRLRTVACDGYASARSDA